MHRPSGLINGELQALNVRLQNYLMKAKRVFREQIFVINLDCYKTQLKILKAYIRTAQIRHQCRKATVLSCHRCPINTGIEKMNNIQI